MDAPQNSPNGAVTTVDDTKQKDLELLKIKQEEWISYCAVGGLITEVDGTIKKMTLVEFSASLGVDRKTLTNWKRSIPDFWERVDKRRGEIFSKSRIAVVWNGLFLRAAKGDVEQAKVILGQYANWQPPAQKHEVKIGGGLADALAAAEARKRDLDNTLEGEVVNATTTDPNS